jgi:archaemetzincin
MCPAANRRGILMTPFGAEDLRLVEELKPLLKDVFGVDIDIGQSIPLPSRAYDGTRRQYRSTVLLDVLAGRKQPDYERQLGITDVDLYVPELNFVFGEADAVRGVAVFSTARLHARDRDRFVHRAATEAIHELGHTYRLPHCSDPHCVMWFSNTLAETDRKGTAFCRAHAGALRRHISEAAQP